MYGLPSYSCLESTYYLSLPVQRKFLFGLKMYTFFNRPLQISYKGALCSKIGVFYAATTLLTLIPPLLIAYRSQGNMDNNFPRFC